MCGITGIINKKGKEVDLALLNKINDLVTHRGPDGRGDFFYNNFGFAHRRLAILDLSESGIQPMTLPEKELTITFNGEIYNYIEIREELKKKGYVFNTQTDTEIILLAYKEWGEKCVNKFNGMWAFAIFDKIKNIIFCSRDRFGIKPFYYTSTDDVFAFGSELKQLLPFQKHLKVNKQILFDYLYINLHQHTNNTFFEGINKLEPSCNLIFDLNTNSFKINKYYQPKIETNYNTWKEEDLISLYKEKIDKAIKLRLRSDVKVGTCLSGGLDSSYIASIASKYYGDTFSAITAKSIEKATDETEYAKKIVNNSKLEWHITSPNNKDFESTIDELLYLQEEPCGGPSLLMQYFVMKEAKKSGCIVLLDGQGGDETLLGYERYFTTYLNASPIHKRLKRFLDISQNSKFNLKDVLLSNLYFNNARIRSKVLQKRNGFINKEYSSFFNQQIIKRIADSFNSVSDLQNIEITSTQLPKLLNYEDKNSMYHSIETRVPFIDYEVLELALSLPLKMKINKGWTKYVIRKAAEKEMPNDVIWRKNKFGFEAPKKSWLGNNNEIVKIINDSEMIKEISGGKQITEFDNLDIKWKLFNIAKWSSQFNVSL